MRFLIVLLSGLILLLLTFYLHSKDVLIDFKSESSPTIISDEVKYPLMIDEMRRVDYPGGRGQD